jgi:hypothetical protein
LCSVLNLEDNTHLLTSSQSFLIACSCKPGWENDGWMDGWMNG